MKARISQLYKTEAEWDRLPDFIPFKGEFIVFSPDAQYSYARLKIGDGNTLLKNLPFLTDPIVNDFTANYDKEIIDGGRISDYKK